jgi:hypothetical protein
MTRPSTSPEINAIEVESNGPRLSRPKLLPVEPEKGVREIGELSYSGPEPFHDARQYCLRNDPS